MNTLKAVLLTLTAIIYLAGGYGLITSALPVMAVWQVVIAASLYSALFAGLGWWLYYNISEN